jgi:chemotaxis signal transduction protein/CheY-like chemotaxis protein/ABC-type nitrate/sulfonate/bicarbonate transport system substrate-binding protein
MTDASKDITILLVEDAAIMRKIEIKTLKSLGYEKVIAATDGTEAVECLKHNENIDLVISDWNMPNMDGFELAVWMRGNDPYKEIPFLMATGQGDKKQEKKALEAGINSFIAKPFNENELKTKINEAMGLVKKDDSAQKPEKRVRVLPSGKVLLRIAHIQITDHIILGVLKNLIAKQKLVPEHFELETVCMPGWNQVQDALEKGEVDGAFILAPIAMDLYNYGADIKLVLMAHKAGSIFVRNASGSYEPPYENFFRNKSFLIPHKMSVHHMLAHMFFSGIGLHPGMVQGQENDVVFEVVAPVKMQEYLQKNADAGGFFVAEPLGTKAIAGGAAALQFLSSELWENHPCCVVTVQNALIGTHDKAVYELVDMLVQAGKFVKSKPEASAEIGVEFLDPEKKLGLKAAILKNVITEAKGISTSDLFPDVHSLKQMNDYMHAKMEIGTPIDMDAFVDIRFAEAACKDRISGHMEARLNTSTEQVACLLEGNIEETGEDAVSKAMLNLEGKYLTFTLGEQEYGIDIMRIREIIGMQEIRSIPDSPDYVKGVINNRGSVIPIIDLKQKFGMGETTMSDYACIVVLESDVGGSVMHMGVTVDSVSEVLAIHATEIEAMSMLGGLFDTRHISGVAKLENGVKLLLNIDHILDDCGLLQLAA